jgi:hypothetical protein
MRKHHWYEEPRWARVFWVALVVTVIAVVGGCASIPGWPPNPIPTPTPEPTPEPLPIPPEAQQCYLMTPPGVYDCYANPPEGEPNDVWAPNWTYVCAPDSNGNLAHVATPDLCPTEPDPEPTPPPTENMWFPIVPQDQITAVRGNPGNWGSALNRAMADLTGCYVGQEPCPVSLPVDLWFQAVCKQLHAGVTVGDETVAFYCGRHVESPIGQVCPPGGGCSDQISVKKESFCDSNFHENYRVINPAENGVRWFPSAKLDAWNVDCTGATWPEEPGEPTEPPVDAPPSGGCTDPDPRGLPGEFVLHCGQGNGTVCDSTYKVRDRDYCDSVCSPLEPDVCFTGRGACPMRMEGDPERHVCYEAVVAPQQWWCDGQPIDPLDHNPARARCTGLAKTCTADGATCGTKDAS